MASTLVAMAFELITMASNLINSDGLHPSSAMASTLVTVAMAYKVIAMASNLINSNGLQPD